MDTGVRMGWAGCAGPVFRRIVISDTRVRGSESPRRFALECGHGSKQREGTKEEAHGRCCSPKQEALLTLGSLPSSTAGSSQVPRGPQRRPQRTASAQEPTLDPLVLSPEAFSQGQAWGAWILQEAGAHLPSEPSLKELTYAKPSAS